MLLIELSPETEAQLQHQRLKGEGLTNALARIVAEAYADLMTSGDPRVP